MPRRVPQQDVICLVVPEGVDPDSDEVMMEVNKMAYLAIRGQFPARSRVQFDMLVIEWMFTNNIEDVGKFQPVHDCPTCREGNVKSRQFLTDNPGRHIAMGNVTYTEVWPDYEFPEGVPEDEQRLMSQIMDVDDRIDVPTAQKLLDISKRKAEEAIQWRKQQSWKKI